MGTMLNFGYIIFNLQIDDYNEYIPVIVAISCVDNIIESYTKSGY